MKRERPEVTRRLVALRKEHSESQSAFARLLGIGQPRWSNLEHGYSLSKDVERRLVKAIPGLKRDWLWSGDGEMPKKATQVAAASQEGAMVFRFWGIKDDGERPDLLARVEFDSLDVAIEKVRSYLREVVAEGRYRRIEVSYEVKP